jgi:regulator of sirC expression with transglutaminase-like and TPR domain
LPARPRQRIGGKLLATYLETRRGNCVSMPALFLILADRLGLDVAFATAPLHAFVRYRAEGGQVVNIEATSGGHPARDAWYREQMPMTDRAIASGLYLRTLSKREGVALLATTVLEHMIEQRRLDEALSVSEVILNHAPHDAYTMVKQATICGAILARNFEMKHANPATIPPHLRPCWAMLAERNRTMWAAAEKLGWEAV